MPYGPQRLRGLSGPPMYVLEHSAHTVVTLRRGTGSWPQENLLTALRRLFLTDTLKLYIFQGKSRDKTTSQRRLVRIV